MRVTFPRLPDHQRGRALVERDDGVSYWLSGGPVTAALPHDLVHLSVERSLRINDGIWAAIAGGVVFQSMEHHSGRRPPHATERSKALIRAYRDRIQRAEVLGGFVERVAALPDPTPARIATLAREALSTLPDGEVDLELVAKAAADLHELERRWAALAVGEELVVDWPAYRRLA